MARPLRIEYPGAYYNVTSRGNERKEIYRDNEDRDRILVLLERWRSHPSRPLEG